MTETLPREIIKWIQGLDLSYSVKDYKKDLSNGFLIAEILSRYFTGQVPMHSFDNSQKKERRQNNWQQLEKFFQKQELALSRKDFGKIADDNDSKTIVEFMVKLYKELTGKKINRNALSVIQNFNKTLNASGKQEDFNQSFLLKERGLEKLNAEKEHHHEEKKIHEKEEGKHKEEKDQKEAPKAASHYELTKNSSLSTSNKLKTFLKYEQRPISHRPELSNLKFEVKSTNIRPLNINVSKLRATKENNLTIGGSSSNAHLHPDIGGNLERPPPSPKQHLAHTLTGTQTDGSKTQTSKKERLVEKSIYDIMNEYFENRFTDSSFIGEYQHFSLKTFPESISNFSDNYVQAVFKEISDRIDPISHFIVRDMNETWKFLTFMLNCLKNVSIDKEFFKTMIQILKYIGEKSVQRDPNKSLKLLKENFLEIIYNQISTASVFEKKEHLAMLLYYFTPNTPESKTQVILAYKEVAKDLKIFLETFVILIASERNRDNPMETFFYFDIGMKYAKSGIQSSHPVIKTMSLAILANLARLNYEHVLDFVRSRLDELSLEEWWEDKAQIIIICSRIISGLVNTDSYQNLVKKNTMNYTKNYSWQNEQLANKLKEDIKLFGDTIIKILQSKPNNSVVRVFMVYCVEICHEVKGIMDQIVVILIQSNDQFRDWFFNNKEEAREEFFVYNDKSLRYRTSFNSEELKKISREFLMSLTENVKENQPQALDMSHLEILEFGLIYTDFKILNVELLTGITNLFVEYVFLALCEEDLIDIASRIIKIFLNYRIEQDLRIKDLEKLFAANMINLQQNGQETCLSAIKELVIWYSQEVDRRKLYREKGLFKDILQSVVSYEADPQAIEEIKTFMESVVNSFEGETEAT